MEVLQNIKPIHLGLFNQICENCNALYFASEATKREKIYTTCCGKGKVKLESHRPLPDVLKGLFLGTERQI